MTKQYQSRKCYGFRYFSGRSTTTGHPNEITGRMSIAGEAVVFSSRDERQVWIENEKLSSPCGSGGGERIVCTKKVLRSLCLGESLGAWEENLDYLEEN